jgi:nucleoside-diphosphate-sugar epimerase
MNILLIGATGQIGYALTRALSQTVHRVSILVRDKHKLAFPESVRVHESREFTSDAFSTALRDVDCVIYGVGLPEQFSFDTRIFRQVNYDLFKLFIDVLNRSPVRRLIYISTYEVFKPIDVIIRESHPIADPHTMTPYFNAMTQAYQLVTERAKEMNLSLTTIHPAAVYGGRNTRDDFTNYIENLFHRRFWRAPVIINGRFPVVHADSLASAIIRALDKPGAYFEQEIGRYIKLSSQIIP